MRKSYLKPETESLTMHVMGALCLSVVGENNQTTETPPPGPPTTAPGRKVVF